MKQIFSLLAAMSIALSSLAQNGKISGNIKDGGNQKIIDAATISLVKAKDSSLVKAIFADKQGHFQFDNVKDGNYLVLATSVGHSKTFSEQISINSTNAVVDLGTLQLIPETKNLKGVTVVAKKPLIEHKIDKTVVNVDASISNVGSNALEVLEKSPGVTVDKDGNISLKGKQGVKVLIDGKLSYLSGADLANLLRNMQSAQLDQIEIMTNPSAKYDASGNSGIINIKTKKTKTIGFNGSATTGYTQGLVSRTNESINLNFRKNKVNLFGNYSYSYRNKWQNLDILRKFRDKDTKELLNIFDQQARLRGANQNNDLKLGIDYYVSKKTTVGAVVSGFYNPETFRNDNNTFLENAQSQVLSRTTALSEMNNSWKNFSGNFNMRHVFDSAGRELTADLDYSNYKSSSKQTLSNNYFDANNIKNAPGDTLIGTIPSDITIYSAKVDYAQNIGKAKLEAGLKYSSVKTDNDAKYDSSKNNILVPDYGRSNHFLYEEQIKAAYVNVSGSLNKKWDAQVGLRLENTNSKGNQLTTGQNFKRDYTQLFPTAYLSYKMNEKNVFSLNYGRRIERPDYGDLNPFYFFLDKYTYQVGNPELKPQFSHNIELSHSYKNFLNTTFNYYKATDIINDIFEQNDATKETYIKKSNIASQQQLGLAISAQIPVKKWLDLNVYTNVSNNIYKGIINNGYVKLKSTLFMSNVSAQFNFGKGWKASADGFYRSKGLDGVFNISAMSAMNAGVSKTILKNKGTLKMGIRDIFHSQNAQGSAQYGYIDTKFSEMRDSRQVSLSFTYRFSKGKGTAAPKRQIGGANEEKGRVKSGS
ncbi:MAG: TonB-dependent receptor [Ferruginibacter sp.]